MLGRYPAQMFGAVFALLSLLLLCPILLAAEVTVTGKVLGPDAEPVAGAKVWVFRFLQRSSGTEKLIAATITGEDGTFSLQDRDEDIPLDLKRWYVYAYAEGLAVDCVHTDDPSKALELELLEPGVTSGRIVGAEGKPLAGASVKMSSYRIGQWGAPGYRSVVLVNEVAEACAVLTEESGVFELRAAPQRAGVSLHVSADGYGTVYVPSGVSLVPLRLEPAGSLQVRIVGAEEPQVAADLELFAMRLEPAGSLQVRIVGAEEPQVAADLELFAIGESRADGTSPHGLARTDAEGNFRFEELPPARYAVRVWRQPSAQYHFRGQTNVEVKSGEETVIELSAEKTAPVWGRVVEAGTFNGVAGAKVTLNHVDGSYTAGGETDAEGFFEVPCLPGNASLRVHSAEGYLDKYGGNFENTVYGLAVGAIELERSHTLAVMVVDEAGQPVPGATVTCEGREGFWGDIRGQSDEFGIFEAKGLEAGLVTVRAEKGELMAEPVQVQVGEEQGPVSLVVQAGAISAVTATILDQDQNPVLDARVYVLERREKPTRDRLIDPPDEQGCVVGKGLVPGAECQIRVNAPGCEQVQTEKWIATEGASHDFGIITVIRHRGFIAGVVVDEAGQAVPGIKVFNSGDAVRQVVTATDPRGRFRLEGLAEGQAYAFVDSPEHHFTGVLAPTGSEDLHIVLEPRGPVSVGEPIVAPRSVMPPGTAREIARQLLLEAAEQTHGETGYYRDRILTTLAELDPQAALAAAAAGGDDLGPVNLAIGRQYLAVDFGRGTELIRAGGNPLDQVRKLLDAAEEYAPNDPRLAVKCLEEVFDTIPQLEQAHWRVVYTARLGTFIMRHDEQRGSKLLASARTRAEHLGVSDYDAYARGIVAANICERDLDAALALIESLPDEDHYNRHMRNVARRIAKTDPDQALDVLRQLSTDWKRQRALAVILPFFPPEQFDRAVALAREIKTGHDLTLVRAQALTKLSCAGPTERVAELIDEAVATVERAAASSSMSRHIYSEALAAIACVARHLGYERYEEVALRAASHRARGEQHYADSSLDVRDEFELANLLAFTLPELARHVIKSGINRVGGIEKLNPEVYGSLASAAAQVDVNWARELLAQMRRSELGDRQIHCGNAARLIAKTLLEDPEERATWWLTRYESWLPVDEDQ